MLENGNPSREQNSAEGEVKLPQRQHFDGIAKVSTERELGNLFSDPSLSATYLERDPSPYAALLEYIRYDNPRSYPVIAYAHFDAVKGKSPIEVLKGCNTYEEVLEKAIELSRKSSPKIPVPLLDALYKDLISTRDLAIELFKTDKIQITTKELSLEALKAHPGRGDPVEGYWTPHVDTEVTANLLWTPCSDYDISTGLYPNDNRDAQNDDPNAIKNADDRLDLKPNWLGLILGTNIAEGRIPSVHRGVPLEPGKSRYFHSILTCENIEMARGN